MAAFGPWADLNSELLVSIAAVGGLSLRDYMCLRGVCTAWRSALTTPPFPSLLVLADDGRASVFSLPMQRSFHLYTASALAYRIRNRFIGPSRLHSYDRFIDPSNPRGYDRFIDPSTLHGHGYDDHFIDPSTLCIVGSCNGCFAVAGDWKGYGFSYWRKAGIFLLNPRTGEEIELLPLTRNGGFLRKIVFAPNPRSDDCTAVAICGLKKVSYTSTGDMDWTIIDVVTAVKEHLADLVYDPEGSKVYCLDSRGDVHVLHIPRGGRRQKPVVEPLLAGRAGLPFDPAAVFAPPYDIASRLTFSKNLFFYDGSLYQVWQNTSATVISPLPAGGGFTMSADEIFVLRYDPGRSPCWDAVKDLGGCSVFIGKNSPVVVRAEAVPGVRANCVYWIDWLGVPMVCDIATGASTPCVLPCGVCRGRCWYFYSDDMTNTDSNVNGGKQCVSGDKEQSTAKKLKIIPAEKKTWKI